MFAICKALLSVNFKFEKSNISNVLLAIKANPRNRGAAKFPYKSLLEASISSLKF